MATDHSIKRTPSKFFRSVVHRWNRRGIVEIGPEDDKLFKLTRNIRTGLRLLLETDTLTDETVLEKSFTLEDNKICSLQALQPNTFQELRQEQNLTDQDFLASIAPSDPSLGYLQFLSSSKSGQLFVFCNDKRYIIKTEKKKDAKQFMRILPSYVNHLKDYPHSLIVRYMGFYCIYQKGGKHIFFSVMKNVFYPDGRIIERYDLKGCQANRIVKLSTKSNPVGLVLKDQNFNKQTINLGPQKKWFDRQISIDTDFMQAVGVIDYSLLLGKQPLLQSDRVLDERLADVVSRIQKSIKQKDAKQRECCSDDIITLHHSENKSEENNDLDNERSKTNNDNRPMHKLFNIVNDIKSTTIKEADLTSAVHLPGTAEAPITSSMTSKTMQLSSAIPLRATAEESTIPTKHNLAPELNHNMDDAEHSNIRLLANLENSLHILDGVDDRYFLGIIDFFTTYGPKKKLEHAVKSVLHPLSSFSAVGVLQYADRFKDYLASKSV